MKIDQDHLYYGAALIQIAEHPSFTAINTFKKGKKAVRCAYWVNEGIGVYLKYRSRADRTSWWGEKAAKEYLFVFNKDACRHLQLMEHKHEGVVFLGLICVADGEICCLSIAQFNELLRLRRENKGTDESQYTIVASLVKNGRFRVYVTPAGKRNKVLGNEIIVARNKFPDAIFE